MVDISRCVKLLDEIPQSCVSEWGETPGGLKHCDKYTEPAGECLNKLEWKGGGEKDWKVALIYYTDPYLRLAGRINFEFSKDVHGFDAWEKTMAPIRKIFFASIAHADQELIEQVSKVLQEAISKGTHYFKKEFVDYLKNADLKNILPLGVTWGDNKDAAILLLKIIAVSKNDPMKSGWERKYISEVTKYFPTKPLVPPVVKP